MTAPAIILSHPQMGENIGAAARAMKNFGLADLRLIAPQCGWPNERAQVLASGAGDIIERTRVFATAAQALADIQLVFATTARDRDVLRDILTPEAAATRLRAASSEGLASAILFGGERAGLDNEEMSLAEAAITIPTAEFPSLNLGQAVLLIGYEWLKSADATPGQRRRKTAAQPASRADMMGLFEHLERELDAAQFLYPPEKKETMVRNMRAMILRSQLSDQEVRTIRGMIVALVKNKYRGGKS
ncbi:MAG TPA: RNA methyltransferase [Rhizomicrobium sp.]|jgi:tRNA/rRNA methyltransferase|nr:RNA methyltransferase [Rhizomicrobium sp.]